MRSLDQRGLNVEHYRVADLSAFSNEAYRGCFIAMKAFLDSSGQSKDIRPFRPKVVTLTAYIGTSDHFKNFESGWDEALEKKDAPIYVDSESGRRSRYFHFNEAINYQDGYDGWNEIRTRDLINSLFNVFGATDRAQSRLISCTVNLDGYAEARKRKPSLPELPEQICADIVFSLLFSYQHEGARVSELFIDRGDWFCKRIMHLWSFAKRSKRPWWAKHVAAVVAADSHFIYPVQSVDLVAGIAQRHYTNGPTDTWGRLYGPTMIFAPHDNVVYDGPELLNMTDESGKYVSGKSQIRPAKLKI